MAFISTHFLSLILFLPALAGVFMLFLPSGENKLFRWFALVASLIPFLLSVLNLVPIQSLRAWFPISGTIRMVRSARLHPPPRRGWSLAHDGLATTLLTPLAILASFNITEKVKAYMMLFLFLETGMLGVFMSLDLLVFFVFWEVGLIPMYFLINQWGSANRNYASMKFLIYTMGGSLGLLLAIQLPGVLFGTYDLLALTQRWTSLQPDSTLLGMSVSQVKAIAFWAFAIAFAIKVPIWPFHTWLPDAHTEAPTASSMILAGVLLKLGACYINKSAGQ